MDMSIAAQNREGVLQGRLSEAVSGTAFAAPQLHELSLVRL